jgi:hypothetical protein
VLSSVGIEGINMDEAKENAEKLSSLWEEDIRFYFKLLLKPWEAFEKPIPTRLSLELAAIATLFSLDISSPFPGKRDSVATFLRLFLLTYISLILYGLFYFVYFIVILGIVFVTFILNSSAIRFGFPRFI